MTRNLRRQPSVMSTAVSKANSFVRHLRSSPLMQKGSSILRGGLVEMRSVVAKRKRKKEGEKQMEDDGKKYNRKRRWRMRRMMGNVQEEKKS